MPGFSLTVLLLPRGDEDAVIPTDDILELLDAPTSSSSWKPAASINSTPEEDHTPSIDLLSRQRSTQNTMPATEPKTFICALKRACEAIVQAEPEITRMDTVAGDGDCGLTLKAGAEGVNL
jgi:triose/dihydroxyacetone kinase / FAD-AMP lyase (cyclizing)